MSYITKVVLENFMRFRGKHELDLGPGCYAIVAKHVEDDGMSNGLGKSSFTSAIRWAFDGKKVDDVEALDDYISAGEKKTSVAIHLSDGTRMVRSRSRGQSTDFELWTDGKQAKKEEAQELLDTVLGISAKDRLSTSWCEQGKASDLVRAGSSDLTRMVERWIGDSLAKLVLAGAIVSERFEDAAKQHVAAIERHSDLVRIGADEVVSQREHTVHIEKLTFEQAEADFKKAYEQRQSIAPRGELSNLLEDYDKTLNQIESLGVQDVPDFDSESLNAAVDELQPLSNERDRTSRELDLRKSLVVSQFGGACPISPGFTCPAKTEINSRSSQNKEALEKARTDFAAANAKYGEAELKVRKLKVLQSNVTKIELQNSKVEGKKEELEKRLLDLKKNIDKAESEGIQPLPKGYAPAPWPTAPNRYRLTAAEKELEIAVKANAGIQEASKLVSDTAKALRAYRLAMSILGPEGARKKVIEKPVARIAYDATVALEDAGVGQTVKPVWGKQLGRLADQCSECGTAFPASAKVKKCESCGALRGQEVQHEFQWKLKFVSGAGNDLGGIGLRVGAYRWLKLNRGAVFSTAIFDEVTGQLDRTRRRAVSSSIRRLLVGVFEQAMIVSHSAEGVEACEHRILITGDDEWSKIEVVQ